MGARTKPIRRYNVSRWARGAALAVRSANKIRRSYTRTTQLRKQTAVRPITGENDITFSYRRKRMPRRRRRGWVKFVRKTQAVIQKQIAPCVEIRHRAETMVSSANKQATSHIHTALGVNGGAHFEDVRSVWQRVQQIATEGGTQNFDHNRFMITGWMLETQVVNESESTAFVDLYYWRSKKLLPSASATTTITSFYGDMAGRMETIYPSGGSALSMTDYGWTPFQAPSAATAITISKKVRVKLAPGGVTQIETRSGKNYRLNYDFQQAYANMYGTCGVFMIGYGTPSITNTAADPVTLRLSTNMNITYRLLKGSVSGAGENAL